MVSFNAKAKKFLVLDFGSSQIKGFLFQRNQNKNILQKMAVEPIKSFGVFSSVSAAKLPTTDALPQDFSLEIVKKAAQNVLDRLRPESNKSCPTIIGLPANCLKARVVVVSYKRQQVNKKISGREAENIYQQVFQEAKNQILVEFKRNGQALPQEIKFLRARILDIKISGYQVSSILGFKGECFDFSVLVMLLNNIIWSDFQKIIPALGLKSYQITHVAEGLVKARPFLRREQVIFIEIGAQFTQFFGFHDGILELAGDFAGGGAELSLALRNSLKMRDAEAEELKIAFSSGNLTEKVAEKVRKTLSSLMVNWAGQLKDLASNAHFANSPVLLLGGACSIPDLEKTFNENVLFSGRQTYSIAVLNISDLPIVNPNSFKIPPSCFGPLLLSFV